MAELSQLIRCGRPQGHQPYSVGRFSRYWSSERSPQLFQIISEVKMGAVDSEEEDWAEVTFLDALASLAFKLRVSE